MAGGTSAPPSPFQQKDGEGRASYVIGDATSKIANYVVTRLLEVSLRAPGEPVARYATSIFLDMITAFPDADVDEFRNGVAMSRTLARWQGDQHDEVFGLLTQAVSGLFRR